ncbi:PP0621 family protein [Nitrosomonas sp.]|uniref:PP0621 family protein n=1 Tax=Nitrosomonas sp. TaxID=42353 RepID=UPI0025DC8C55|nr:PP0621 family protein [Nitrosomonas sp.]
MGKLFFYILIALLIYWIIKNRHSKKDSDISDLDSIEDTVSCVHCGVYLPKSEAINYQNKYFCCQEHCDKFLSS